MSTPTSETWETLPKEIRDQVPPNGIASAFIYSYVVIITTEGTLRRFYYETGKGWYEKT